MQRVPRFTLRRAGNASGLNRPRSVASGLCRRVGFEPNLQTTFTGATGELGPPRSPSPYSHMFRLVGPIYALIRRWFPA